MVKRCPPSGRFLFRGVWDTMCSTINSKCKFPRRIRTYTLKLSWFKELRLFMLTFIVCSLLYQVLPLLIFKVPASTVRWHDLDFDLGRVSRKPKQEIIVLYWTALWREYQPVRIFTREQCSDHLENLAFRPRIPLEKVFSMPCRITHDRRYFRESDALVFHSFDLMYEELPEREERKLHPDQVWIYFQHESPIYTRLNLQAFPSVFNWTMTYRRDSDVYVPYAQLLHQTVQTTTHINHSDILRHKHGLVAWIVSSCDSHSKREYFVLELQRHIPVDIFGWCGSDCPSNDGDCYTFVQSKYKFYLSFENSLCTDYITEKFFNTLKTSMVPVVYGGRGARDYEVIAPNHSYIDARSFKSPQDLAQYLLYLDQNEAEYLKYFEWKTWYRLSTSSIGVCNLCQRLHEHLNRINKTDTGVSPRQKWYQDLWSWWNYMSNETSVVAPFEQQVSSQSAVIGQSYHYNWGAPACVPVSKNAFQGDAPNNNHKMTEANVETKPDFEPGVLNGRLFGKLVGWGKELLST